MTDLESVVAIPSRSEVESVREQLAGLVGMGGAL
jgi:hypothetical protein